ncbi:uncharacterized protein LOC122899368 isoform X2 [Neovison vison]|nr:uncharacterized protein LOC122899368 isoform X2 [Neogale vison]
MHRPRLSPASTQLSPGWSSFHRSSHTPAIRLPRVRTSAEPTPSVLGPARQVLTFSCVSAAHGAHAWTDNSGQTRATVQAREKTPSLGPISRARLARGQAASTAPAELGRACLCGISHRPVGGVLKYRIQFCRGNAKNWASRKGHSRSPHRSLWALGWAAPAEKGTEGFSLR